MSNELVPYQEKGLTEEEASLLHKWVEKGKPGLSKYRADKFGEIYVLGYSCRDIHNWFPEYPYEVLLWSRFYYGWDELRAEYKRMRSQQVIETAFGVQAESLRFLTEIMHATHLHWRRELLAYLANPDTNKPPGCLPQSLGQYSQLNEMLQTMLGIGPPSKDKGKPGEVPSSPLISINIGDEKKSIRVSGPEDVKAAIIQDVKNAERVQRD